ncbi:hypothetical protein ASPFODRAFT_532511 [Aspergillus luchuensis CBS 106.47]|uniref:Uncharacterized protein n=1 Tax=Aspergillus luchuensis (strain CBS 106.47) TaxID=1137211 RepID=A0A1M3TMW3_ASPLC|nr:hypothetical protein ASPFODRAFT_532511 [Aspergillus luchuensis CBS 106.47]
MSTTCSCIVLGSLAPIVVTLACACWYRRIVVTASLYLLMVLRTTVIINGGPSTLKLGDFPRIQFLHHPNSRNLRNTLYLSEVICRVHSKLAPLSGIEYFRCE